MSDPKCAQVVATAGTVSVLCDKTGTHYDDRGIAFCAFHFGELFTTFVPVDELKIGDGTELGKVIGLSTDDRGRITLRLDSPTTARYYSRPFLGTEMIRVRR